MLVGNPAFTLTAVLCLSLGIGACITIFSLFNELFLRPFPDPHQERLVDLNETVPKWDLEYTAVCYADFHAWREHNKTFECMGTFANWGANLSVDDKAERVDESILLRLLYSWLFGVFAVVAGIMAFAGIYGVISYSVSQRTREIGIRVALGARSGDIARHVMRQGAVLIVIGLLIGLLGALAISRVLASQLFGVSATDVTTFVSVSALLVAVALLACYLPARRASRVDPIAALRCE